MGLKPDRSRRDGRDVRFQTYPRGVEADEYDRPRISDGEFQTYPRGVEALDEMATRVGSDLGFRRTLVGLKLLQHLDPLRQPAGFRRTLVGLKARRSGAGGVGGRVSDVPSWG